MLNNTRGSGQQQTMVFDPTTGKFRPGAIKANDRDVYVEIANKGFFHDVKSDWINTFPRRWKLVVLLAFQVVTSVRLEITVDQWKLVLCSLEGLRSL